MAGGLAVIISILAILIVIAAKSAPLFGSPSIHQRPALELGEHEIALALGCDEHQQVYYKVTARGISCYTLDSSGAGESVRAVTTFTKEIHLGNTEIVVSSERFHGTLALAYADGRLALPKLSFQSSLPSGPDGPRLVVPRVECDEPFALLGADKDNQVKALVLGEDGDGFVVCAALADGSVSVVRVSEDGIGESSGLSLMSQETDATGPVQERLGMSLRTGEKITVLALSESARHLFAGTNTGRVLAHDLERKEPAGDFVSADVPITRLATLIGNRTLVSADAGGAVATWQMVRRKRVDGETGAPPARLERMHQFEAHDARVEAIGVSERNKTFVTADAGGALKIHYGTTGKTLLTVSSAASELKAVALTPKSDGIIALGGDGRLLRWNLDSPHPEVSAEALFSEVWYEGYEEPDYVWQSTSGSQDFEPKLSLSPLILGTLKGTFYALIFAVPLGLLGALYASQFMHHRLRQWVKPSIEIMAALPSVVLGFLAGLWLAPMVEGIAPGVFAMILVLPMTILLTLLAWERLPSAFRSRFLPPGREIYLLVPVVLAGTALSILVGFFLNEGFFAGDYRVWMTKHGMKYDQRNSLVVGIAMGIAVIPIIFTIAEDSLSNVPKHLTAGALALGSTPWQAAVRVVLPTASPGIFSAIMIGFGRAVGETMIVLMATGNTAVMDFNAFSGFRALSANIAVELPEAAENSTHFRVLFLAAFLLFCMTFIVNTAAEVVRLRLRKRYSLL